jgi:hypothetical protein
LLNGDTDVTAGVDVPPLELEQSQPG